MSEFRIGDRVNNCDYGNGTVFGYLKEHPQIFIVFDKHNGNFHDGSFHEYKSGGPSTSRNGYFIPIHQLDAIDEKQTIDDLLVIARKFYPLGTYFDNSDVVGCKGTHGPVTQLPYKSGNQILVGTPGSAYTIYRADKWATIVCEMDVLLAKAIRAFPIGTFIDNSNIFAGGATSQQTSSAPWISSRDIVVNVDNKITALYREGTWAKLGSKPDQLDPSLRSGHISEDDEIFLRKGNPVISKMIVNGEKYHPTDPRSREFQMAEVAKRVITNSMYGSTSHDFQFRGSNKDLVKLHTKPAAKQNNTLEGVVVKLDTRFVKKKIIKIL